MPDFILSPGITSVNNIDKILRDYWIQKSRVDNHRDSGVRPLGFKCWLCDTERNIYFSVLPCPHLQSEDDNSTYCIGLS